MKHDIEAIKKHVAGATVRHSSPFDGLKSYRNPSELSPEFIKEWVNPYYMELRRSDEKWVQFLANIKSTITPQIVETCLGDFNWRTRQTGAYFAALTGQKQFIDTIGTHLLKSEVCYAGMIYARVLAFFNTPACADYINRYLDYYLTQPELYFDQADVMEVALYLDHENGTTNFETHLPQWEKFIEQKHEFWHEPIDTSRTEEFIKVLKRVNIND